VSGLVLVGSKTGARTSRVQQPRSGGKSKAQGASPGKLQQAPKERKKRKPATLPKDAGPEKPLA